MIESKPLKDITQGQNLRYINFLNNTPPPQYSQYLSGIIRVKKYKKHVDLAVQNILKGLFIRTSDV
jgi:hypothetical protein